MSDTHRVVIVGGGFGGLHTARALRRVPVDIALVDRCNYHLFQPLLYQVATGGLSPANIAAPLRGILRKQKNTRVVLGEVVDFDPAERQVLLSQGVLSYDTLIVAAGATHSYFGHEEWARFAPGMKTIEDATVVRAKIFAAFERAENETDPAKRQRLLTFLIVGAGPTGVELAGAISELSHHTLKHDFRRIRPKDARIILVDAVPKVLSVYPDKLSEKAKQFLERLDVEVRTGAMVTEMENECVTLKLNGHEEKIPASTILWAAGVQASPLAQKLSGAIGGSTDRQGRIAVESDLTLPNHPEIFVIGDMALANGVDGKPLPGVAPVAIQQGKYVAQLIRARLRGKTTRPFVYRDWGKLATIGRSLAVAEMKGMHFAGFFAWLLWLFVHLMQLVQFENRVLVLLQWAWSYVTHNRSARLITWQEAKVKAQPSQVEDSNRSGQ